MSFLDYLNPKSIINTVSIDTKNSEIRWQGSNLFKVNKHYGTVNFKSGQVTKTNGRIIGGDFTIEMESIINTDGKYNELLVNHLKNEDFFHVKKYPLAYLKITSINYFNSDNSVQIIANLTIKGVTKPIEFNAIFQVIEGNEVMTSKFIIDRTRWGINYESEGLLGGIKDDIISDSIEFEVAVQWPFRDKC